jgi:plasmid stabilization system protein ParE
MKYKVRITHEAKQEIQALCNYIAQDSPEASQRWRRAIRERILGLQNFPLRHAFASEAEALGIPLHQMVFGSYRVLYTVTEREVIVWGVRHGARRPLEPGDLPR